MNYNTDSKAYSIYSCSPLDSGSLDYFSIELTKSFQFKVQKALRCFTLVFIFLSLHNVSKEVSIENIHPNTCVYICFHITGYGSTLYIGIAMVFVFSPYFEISDS